MTVLSLAGMSAFTTTHVQHTAVPLEPAAMTTATPAAAIALRQPEDGRVGMGLAHRAVRRAPDNRAVSSADPTTPPHARDRSTGLRERLEAAGARPGEDELTRLLPVLEKRIAAWQALESLDLGDTPPSSPFVPLVDE